MGTVLPGRLVRSMALLTTISLMLGCVEKRLPTKPVDSPPPHPRVLLGIDGKTSDWTAITDTFPAPGKVDLTLTRLHGNLDTIRFDVSSTATCQERDRISRELVTTIERTPDQALLAPTLLGTVGAVVGIGWSAYGLTQNSKLPPPSPAASGNENRQDQLTQVTLPLTTLGVSLVLLAIPAFASIDGEERSPHGDRLGGAEAGKPCLEQDLAVTLRVSSGFFDQPVTSTEVMASDGQLHLGSANIVGAIERLATLQKICTANCPSGPRAYRPISADERKSRIQKARSEIVAFLEGLKSQLRGRLARRNPAYGRALAETNRVILVMNRSQRVELDSLARLLASAGDALRAEKARSLVAAYRAVLPSSGSTQLARGPQYMTLRPIDRLIATPWTCVTSRGLNPFVARLGTDGLKASVTQRGEEEVCIDWSKHPSVSSRVRTSRKAAAHSVLQDTLPLGAPLVMQATRGELPLQATTPKNRLASRQAIVMAIKAAAVELNVRTVDGQDDVSIAALLEDVAWAQIKASPNRVQVTQFLQVYGGKSARHREAAQRLLATLEQEGQ